MISNIFLISRSILFWINIVFSVLIFGPVTFLLGIISYDICLYFSKQWCRYNLLFLKYVCLLSYNFDNPRLYDLKASAVDFKELEGNVAINLVADDINWDVEITLEYGSKGLPSEVTQSIHPFFSPAKLRFYYKY